MCVRLFSDVSHFMTTLDQECACMYTVCLGLKYDDVGKGKTCDRGTSLRTENALFILFCLRK